MVITDGDFNGHVGKEVNGYEGVHGGYGYDIRYTEGEDILKMTATLDRVVCNTWFIKRDSRPITYSSGTCSTKIAHILVRNNDRKLIRDVKVIQVKKLYLSITL